MIYLCSENTNVRSTEIWFTINAKFVNDTYFKWNSHVRILTPDIAPLGILWGKFIRISIISFNVSIVLDDRKESEGRKIVCP